MRSTDAVLEILNASWPKIESQARELTGRLSLYKFTRDGLLHRNVGKDLEYQSTFRDFYRMRAPSSVQQEMFRILEQQKRDQHVDFETVMYRILERTNRVEPSFASKIVATINPDRAIYDSKVRKLLKLNYSWHKLARERCKRAAQIYGEIDRFVNTALTCPKYEKLLSRFDRTFPDYRGLCPVKKLDFLMYQHDESERITRDLS